MSSYRYLGYGITNENGVAQLKYDENGDELEHSYTGVGAGELDVLASLDNPITSGSVQSNTYEVLDCIFKDIGTSSDYGTWTSTDFTGSKISRDSECTTLTPEDTYDAQSETITDGNMDIEFDVNITFTTASDFIRVIGSNAVSWTQTDLGLTSGQWYSIKLQKRNGEFTPIVDGTTLTNKKKTITISSSFVLRFVLSNAVLSNMKYKNLKVYPV